MSSETEHCLRAKFTISLATRLLAGESLTLTSPHGQGRRRTLDDLRNRLPDSTDIIQINMRTYCIDYKGFIREVVNATGYQNRGITSLNNLLDLITKEQQQRLIILHNFDEIRDRRAAASGYTPAFFSDLNSIRHRPGISLLCVCEQVFNNYLLQADGSELPASTLESEVVELPPLSPEQILLELQRRALPVAEDALPLICEWLRAQPAPYSMLDQSNHEWLKQKVWKKGFSIPR